MSCISKSNYIKNDNIECYRIVPRVEIWYNGGNKNLIGNFYETFKDTFLKSDGWNRDYYPFPKKYDIKLIFIDNDKVYDHEDSISSNKRVLVNAYFYYVLGRHVSVDYVDVNYLLNPIKSDTHQIVTNQLIIIDDTIKYLWKKNIDLEKDYLIFNERGYYISRIVFNIIINDSCLYEYTLNMKPSDET